MKKAEKRHKIIDRSTVKEIEKMATLDYARGMSLKYIASKYNVKKNIVVGWHRRNNWKEKREDYLKKYSETIFVKFTKNAEDATARNLEVCKIMAQICYEMMAETYKKKGFLNRVEELTKIFKLAQLSYSAPPVVMPSLPGDIGEKILQELKNLKMSINDGDDEDDGNFTQKNK